METWGAIVGDRKVWVRDIAFTAAISLVFTFLAPFGTDRVPLQLRLVENFAVGFASFILLWPPMRLALRYGLRAGLPELFILGLGLAALSLPVAVIGSLIIGQFRHGPPPGLMTGYFIVLAMVLPVGSAYLMVERRLTRAPPDEPLAPPPGAPQPSTASPRLLARLPARLGGEVLALQAEDHYVRVHTRLGSDLLLMRFSDAVEGLGALQGERVHRSWWVARGAVEAAKSRGRRLTLTLANGLEVPVTRGAAAKLRRDGWLKR